jgi:hypothetical protein
MEAAKQASEERRQTNESRLGGKKSQPKQHKNVLSRAGVCKLT